MIDNLQTVWSGLLQLINTLVSPDWGALVGLLPIFIIVGVIGPLLSLIVLGWVYYAVRRPRARVHFEDDPTPVPVDSSGEPVFPAGLPYCVRHRVVYEPGATRCDVDAAALAVICPMCGVGRDAAIDTCGNCGLVLKVQRRMRVSTTITPPPGGAAIA